MINNIYPEYVRVGDTLLSPRTEEVIGVVVVRPIYDSLTLYATVRPPDGELLYVEIPLGHRIPVNLKSTVKAAVNPRAEASKRVNRVTREAGDGCKTE